MPSLPEDSRPSIDVDASPQLLVNLSESKLDCGNVDDHRGCLDEDDRTMV